MKLLTIQYFCAFAILSIIFGGYVAQALSNRNTHRNKWKTKLTQAPAEGAVNAKGPKIDTQSVFNMFGKSDSPCEGNCITMEKVMAIFPLDKEEANIDNQLNKFSWKYLQLYNDHLSVFSSKKQDPPVAGKPEKPNQADFLNNYPLQSLLTPCQSGMAVCTAENFRDEVMKPKGFKFELPESVSSPIGSQAYKQCLVLLQDLSMSQKTEKLFYICSQDYNTVMRLRELMSRLLPKQKMPEGVARAFMVSPSQTELIELNLHIDDKFFIGNNKEEELLEAQKKPDYKEYFKYQLGVDFSQPAAALPSKEKVVVPWKGDPAKKPDDLRCFMDFIIKGADPTAPRKEYLCFYTSPNGLEKQSPQEAQLQAQEWVDKLNRMAKKLAIDKAQAFCQKLTGNVDPNASELDPLKQELHRFAVALEKTCDESISQQLKTQDQCNADRKVAIADKIGELSSQNQGCMKALAQAVQQGLVPLSDKGCKSAWSPDNPYRQADGKPSALDQQKPEKPTTPADKAADALAKELGIDTSAATPTKQLSPAPTKEELMKAVNTFKRILQGKQVDKLDGIEVVCKPVTVGASVSRAIGMVPFIARFDPWLEYLGYVRDVQSSAKN